LHPDAIEYFSSNAMSKHYKPLDKRVDQHKSTEYHHVASHNEQLPNVARGASWSYGHNLAQPIPDHFMSTVQAASATMAAAVEAAKHDSAHQHEPAAPETADGMQLQRIEPGETKPRVYASTTALMSAAFSPLGNARRMPKPSYSQNLPAPAALVALAMADPTTLPPAGRGPRVSKAAAAGEPEFSLQSPHGYDKTDAFRTTSNVSYQPTSAEAVAASANVSNQPKGSSLQFGDTSVSHFHRKETSTSPSQMRRDFQRLPRPPVESPHASAAHHGAASTAVNSNEGITTVKGAICFGNHKVAYRTNSMDSFDAKPIPSVADGTALAPVHSTGLVFGDEAVAYESSYQRSHGAHTSLTAVSPADRAAQSTTEMTDQQGIEFGTERIAYESTAGAAFVAPGAHEYASGGQKVNPRVTSVQLGTPGYVQYQSLSRASFPAYAHAEVAAAQVEIKDTIADSRQNIVFGTEHGGYASVAGTSYVQHPIVVEPPILQERGSSIRFSG
jgi:hypothetical protein